MTVSQAIERLQNAERALEISCATARVARATLAIELQRTFGLRREDSPWAIETNGFVVRAVFIAGMWEVSLHKNHLSPLMPSSVS